MGDVRPLKVPDAWRAASEEAKLNKLSSAEIAKVAQKLVERASEVAIAATIGDVQALDMRSRELVKTLAVVLAKRNIDLHQCLDAAMQEKPVTGA